MVGQLAFISLSYTYSIPSSPILFPSSSHTLSLSQSYLIAHHHSACVRVSLLPSHAFCVIHLLSIVPLQLAQNAVTGYSVLWYDTSKSGRERNGATEQQCPSACRQQPIVAVLRSNIDPAAAAAGSRRKDCAELQSCGCTLQALCRMWRVEGINGG